MSRTVLWITTVFLSLAMIALVAVQGYWIKSSKDSKERQMGLLMNQVLADISDELVENETVLQILEELRPPLIRHQSQTVWNFQIDARSSYDVTAKEEVQHDEDVLLFTPPHKSLKNQKVELIDDSVLVILGEDELLEDTILISAMKPEQIRMKLNENMKEQEVFVNKIVRKMLAEQVNLEDKISKSQIEELLHSNLEQRGIDMPFEYALYKEGSPPIFQSESFNEYEDCMYYRTSLFPGELFSRKTMLSVYFPTEEQHFIKSMGILGGTSLLITLFVLLLFSLALYIIFKQKKLSEMKNDFVNNMTHELKTPISTISLASQMLNDRSIPDAQKNFAQISRIIQTESKQLGFQVERVLQMAIFDHGQLKLKLEEVDLHEVIETVAQNFLLQLEKKDGRLEFLPEAESAVITGDLMHLTNVVSNLIENAVKYTKQTPEIRISTSSENESLVISVSDNGIGISKEDQKRIFDKFYRVPTGNVHNVKGFGLGLSYVKLIVEHHHGSIHIKSEPEKGSRFDIHLPLKVE
jgi:two-component system phosphate regulon sensor histidine kinase PhoR